MKKKECPSCAMEINSDSKVCPVCGFEFPDTHKNKPWVLLLLLGLFLLVSFIVWYRKVF